MFSLQIPSQEFQQKSLAEIGVSLQFDKAALSKAEHKKIQKGKDNYFYSSFEIMCLKYGAFILVAIRKPITGCALWLKKKKKSWKGPPVVHPASNREHNCLLASIFELLSGLKVVFLSKYPHDYRITQLC